MALRAVRQRGRSVALILAPAGRSIGRLVWELVMGVGMAAFLAAWLTAFLSVLGMLALALTIGRLPDVPWLPVSLFVLLTVFILLAATPPMPKPGDLIRLEFTPPQAPTSMRLVRPFSARTMPVADLASITVVEHRLRPPGETADTDDTRDPLAGPALRTGLELRTTAGTTWSAGNVEPEEWHTADAAEVTAWLRDLLAGAGVPVTSTLCWAARRPRSGAGSWVYGGSGSANASGGG